MFKTQHSGVRKVLIMLALCATLIFSIVSLPVSTSAQSNTFTRKQPTTVAMQLVAGNPSRSSLIIQNVGSVIVALGNTSSITYATGILLAPNQRAVIAGTRDGVYGITNASTADLRIVETTSNGAGPKGAPSFDVQRTNTTGVSNDAAATTVPMSDGSNLVAGNVLVYMLTTAITANTTTTATAAGTLAMTSNATGLGSIFRSDGTNWQLLANYSQYNSQSTEATIATTSTSDLYFSVPVTGTLTGIDFSSLDALAANDTNYITFTAINLGQSGGGSTALLAATDPNTTKTTGGTALTALARRQLTLHGTAGNLAVTKGDVVRVRATATGTLAGTVTRSRVIAYFTRLS